MVKGGLDVSFLSAELNLLSSSTFPLRDLHVRQALNYAVNKEEQNRYAFKGNAVKMRGYLTEKCGVDLSGTKSYEWNIPKARELLKDAGYVEGFKMEVFYLEKDYLTAKLLERFYYHLHIELEIKPVNWESVVEHVVYPNTRPYAYPWRDEDCWVVISTRPGYLPELMSLELGAIFSYGAPYQRFPNWLIEPLDSMHNEILRTKDRSRRFEICRKANEYIADQALGIFTVAQLSLYGVNEEVKSSRPQELPPQSLSEPDVNLSVHPALIDQPSVAHQTASGQTNLAGDGQSAPTNVSPFVSFRATVCISSSPTSAGRS